MHKSKENTTIDSSAYKLRITDEKHNEEMGKFLQIGHVRNDYFCIHKGYFSHGKLLLRKSGNILMKK